MKTVVGWAVLVGALLLFFWLHDSSSASQPSPPEQGRPWWEDRASPQALVEDATKQYVKANFLKPGWIVESNVEVRSLSGDSRYEAYCATFKNENAEREAFFNKGRAPGKMLMHHCTVSVSGTTATVHNCTTEK